MRKHNFIAAASLAMLALNSAQAQSPAVGGQTAQAEAGAWHFAATLYFYVPSVAGTTTVPTDPGGGSINVDGSRILDNLKLALMGSFDAHNGRWGVFTDAVYLDFGNVKDQSRDFTIGNIGLPASTSARIDWALSGVAWTSAGQYRLLADPALTLDAIGGARLLDIKQELAWTISGELGPVAPSGRSGRSDAKIELWDALVGVKGRYRFGDDRKWALPFYLDVGAGESRLTWQAAAGIGYAFSWGELQGMWRYLDYQMKPGKTVLKDLSFNGPMVGATFRW
jgi:hypothetical protein